MKKLVLLMVPIMFLLTGCGTEGVVTPENAAGLWDNIIVFFSQSMIWFGSKLGNNIIVGLIVVTVLFRLAMVPLYKKQIKSSSEMAKVQPEIKRIQEKYKGKKDQLSKQKLAQETQAVYAKHGINPLAGCLPMLLQLPLLFAFYGAISNLMLMQPGAEEIGLAVYGVGDMSMNLAFFGDLAKPSIFFAGFAAITTYYSTVLSTIGNEEAAGSDMMKSMKIVMPLMILFMGFTLPGALSIYWSIGNLFTIGQTLILKRHDIKAARDRKKMLQN
jgi:YidC/Oxa1 family membrane protein insertase